MVQSDPAERARAWGPFDPGNVGSYPGRVEKIFPGAAEQTILDVRATDDRNVSLVSVMLSVLPGGNEVTLRAPFCHLSWGVAGGRDQAVIDWLHGQVVTVAGTFLRIGATFPLAKNLNPPGIPPTGVDPETFGGPTTQATDPDLAQQQMLLLGANVAPNPHSVAAFGATPRLTTFHSIPAGGQSDFVPIPSHAQSVTLLGRFAPGDVTNMGAYSTANAAALLYQATNPTPNLDQFAFPIARGVEFVQLASAAADDLLVLLLWTIGL